MRRMRINQQRIQDKKQLIKESNVKEQRKRRMTYIQS